MLAALLVLIPLAAVLALAAKFRELSERVRLLETQAARPSLPAVPPEIPLANLRVALDVRQDHPHAPFAALLREALLADGALVVETAPDLTVRARIVGNGYADVVFTADLAISDPQETVLAWTEKPPHGDRPENLAREVVARLRAERAKRERQSALRELHEPDVS